MKNDILKLVLSELDMTTTPKYREELTKLLMLCENCGSSFEEQMNLYRSAKNIFSDTSPRENLFLIKEDYMNKISKE
jgi:protein-arginine kinase activator protein McsA